VPQPPPTTTPPGTPPETEGVVVGNHTQKYAARNPAVRWLTQRWVANLDHQLARIAAQDTTTSGGGGVLEVGCGEGVIAARLQRRFAQVTALDLPDAGLRAHWRRRRGPRFLHADAQALPFADDRFAVVVAAEVLEHLADPAKGLQELARVGRAHLVLSVPQEPLFRCCNLLAGRYLRQWGNTPGHLHHWSRRGFVRFVAQLAEVREVTSPFPWTTIWATLPGS